MVNENWTEDFERRKAKEAEVEKRTLAFQESYENGDITEEEYQANVKMEYDHSEPSTEWVPIEDPLDPNRGAPQEIDTELSQEYQEVIESEVESATDLEVYEELVDMYDQNQIIEE
ncbi:hypothetical protein [Enterococcus sp. AZ109]|uniref:hypothetical protein n=1 Tax=Enterococcus sp. AZ109 TaxID=2774634 RepID=UPI003F203B51